MITISIIGSGKLSYNLSEAFISNKELRLNEIYSRNNKNIKLFNKKIKFTNEIDSLSEADFYFILTNYSIIFLKKMILSLRSMEYIQTIITEFMSSILCMVPQMRSLS